jgi:hypothetical protein
MCSNGVRGRCWDGPRPTFGSSLERRLLPVRQRGIAIPGWNPQARSAGFEQTVSWAQLLAATKTFAQP